MAQFFSVILLMASITNREIADILSDLIHINADRIGWYEKAIPALLPQDKDLAAVFESNLRKSSELNVFLVEELDDPAPDRSAAEETDSHRAARPVVRC